MATKPTAGVTDAEIENLATFADLFRLIRVHTSADDSLHVGPGKLSGAILAAFGANPTISGLICPNTTRLRFVTSWRV